MATFRRSTVAGATYFFTVNTHQRQKILTKPPFYQALKQNLEAVKERYPFAIEAFVLLPDHLHCIWTLPENDADYSMRWNIIKRGVSQQVRNLTRPRRPRRGASVANWGCGNDVSGSIKSATSAISRNTWSTSTGTR